MRKKKLLVSMLTLMLAVSTTVVPAFASVNQYGELVYDTVNAEVPDGMASTYNEGSWFMPYDESLWDTDIPIVIYYRSDLVSDTDTPLIMMGNFENYYYRDYTESIGVYGICYENTSITDWGETVDFYSLNKDYWWCVAVNREDDTDTADYYPLDEDNPVWENETGASIDRVLIKWISKKDISTEPTSADWKSAWAVWVSTFATSAYHTMPDTREYLPKLDKTVISKISNTTTGVTFSWNKVDDAEGYRIYRKTGSNSYTLYKKITSADTTSFTDTAVTSGTTYTYAVRAYAGSTYSTFTGKSIKYLAPASVSALVNYSKGIQVKWSKITGASGYYIYRKAGSETSWSKVATITSGSTLKWNDTNTTAGLKYQYCVKAYSGSTKGAYKAGVTTYRVTTPTISSVTNSAAGKATVKWNKNTSATGYQISYTTGSTTKTITVSGNTNVSKVISGLTKGKTYTVKVRSYRKVGTTYYYSTWSSAKSVKITK